ncbi:hypothetical protein BBJ28_00011902 [Nothophytophthora sp. Chile5]|nr:hypothetical protein BBJ28_00011902 [Nothophytophthora sp. Chile5]
MATKYYFESIQTEDSSIISSEMISLLPPLTSVTVLLRERPALEQLPHVAELLSAFLERRTELSLAQTCAYGSLTLISRMWEASLTPGDAGDVASTKKWSLRQLLRSDRHYYRHQFTKSLEQAARRGDVRIVQWLFAHFSGCLAEVEVVEVVEAAAAGGHLDILEFLWATGRPLLSVAERGSLLVVRERTPGLRRAFSVEWGRNDAVRAAQNGNREVVWWLLKTVGAAERELDEVARFAVTHGKIPQVQWMLKHGLPEKGAIEPVAGRLDALQWLFEHGNRHFVSAALELAAGHGHLELVEWLVQIDPNVAAIAAMEAACKRGDFAIVRFFLEHGLGLYSDMALHQAASNNHLELADYLAAYGFKSDMAGTMLAAAEKGHLDAVKWLYEHFAVKPEASLFPGPSFCMKAQGGPAKKMMDVAAENGHLEVLQFLHSIDDGAMENRVRKRQHGDRETVFKWEPLCSREAIDRAASNGHLGVIKWLDQNRSEGYSHKALPLAVCGGHTEVVKWLLERNSDDGPVDAAHYSTLDGHPNLAMNFAAMYGHLSIVKLLHVRGAEGCTTEAMDGAAQNGHLEVVQWLHEHRTEGCSRQAIESAAERGHFDVMLFLHSQRLEDCRRNGRGIRRPHFDFAVKELRKLRCEMHLARQQMGFYTPRDIMRWMQEHGYTVREERAAR